MTTLHISTYNTPEAARAGLWLSSKPVEEHLRKKRNDPWGVGMESGRVVLEGVASAVCLFTPWRTTGQFSPTLCTISPLTTTPIITINCNTGRRQLQNIFFNVSNRLLTIEFKL
jgi:hypothetical protein